jgi:hypothetical protein
VFGYYADPVDESMATLPKGWKSRLVNLPPCDTDGVRGLCLDPHHLAIAKCVAEREKDRGCTLELARRGITGQDRLHELLDTTAVDAVRRRVRAEIERSFADVP